MMRSYTQLFVFIVILGFAVGTERYMDYGDENADRDLENLREFYRFLLRRNSFDSNGPIGSPYEHLMIRKSQRSPSLRLRFGRSDPAISPAGLMTRSGSTRDAAFEDN